MAPISRIVVVVGSFRQASLSRRGGFTIPELLVVVGVIALLIAVLLPALAGAKRTADMAESQNNMRQIDTFMKAYSSENRDFIVPSQADYRDPAAPNQTLNNYPVKVRSDPDLGSLRYQATWSDILWTENSLGQSAQQLSGPPDQDKYLYDSPDAAYYDSFPTFEDNPFRSAAPNTRDYTGAVYGPNPGALPFLDGAQEAGLPGYFAANDFFNARPDAPAALGSTSTPALGRWYTAGQIKVPDRAMYLVDSLAGETIHWGTAPDFEPYNNDETANPPTIEVDFRYSGVCLMLFMDGHIDPQGEWKDLIELEGCEAGGNVTQGRGIYVRDLTRRGLPPCP